MINDRLIRLCCCTLIAAAVSCSADPDTTSVGGYGLIDVGGLTKADVAGLDDESEAVPEVIYKAEDLEWFREVLEQGLEVDYSNQYSDGRITAGGIECTLQYHPASGIYTLTRNEDGKPAEWLGNGAHLFVGKYIPEGLFVESDVDKDQHDTTVYNMLSHYTTIKSSALINATVDRISLPFQHRLSRVIAQIIIDPTVRKDYTNPDAPQASIQGYRSTDGGGSDCTLRFCKVQVLEKVNSEGQPVWTVKGEENKIAPHFLGEKNGVFYQKDSLDVGATYDNVPCFDLIVRPTYRGEIIMDDESDDVTDEDDNMIFFHILLDNGMVYEKEVAFNLNPGEQTTITLHIAREGVYCNDAGTDNWVNDNFRQDDYCGIDNELGHNLSKAGSCWQRAYRIGVPDYEVTDGSNPEDTQYITEEVFLQYLSEATEDGDHHGDYFVLTGDLTLPADWSAPVFTGHLDGRHYNITLPAGTDALFSGLNGTYDAPVGTANIHGPNSPMMGYRAELMNIYLTNPGAVFVSGENSGYIYNCHTVE